MAKEKIYYTTVSLGWCINWKPFIITDIQIYDIEKAKKIVRSFFDGTIGLATESQMKLNNAEWDNI